MKNKVKSRQGQKNFKNGNYNMKINKCFLLLYFIEQLCILQKEQMQSRIRKYRKSFDNYEQAIQKQLNDDFQVCQYLDQNKNQGNNMQQYLKLFNSLQVTKNKKKTKYDSLKVSYVQMSTDRIQKTLQSSKVQNWDGIKEEFIKKYQQTQIKTQNQLQVKNNLWKQILQTKKSLNLLKGDIGHLVSRNQSANLLESKMSKVKIVADDQFKRVTLAYTKDKDQIKIRNDMQKKFNKKLKNVSMFQNSTLNKFKKNYIDTMIKKRQIFDRLTYIQKISASINQTGDKQKYKNLINKRSLNMYNHFIQLSNLIHNMPQIQSKYGNSPEEIQQFMEQIQSYCHNDNDDITLGLVTNCGGKLRTQQTMIQNIDSQDLEMINEQNLQKFEELIKKQYVRVNDQIQKLTSQYDWQVKKSEQMVIKLQECNQQMQKIKQNHFSQANLKYIITKDIRGQYSTKLKKYIEVLKTIFALLEFIQKYVSYSTKQNKQQIKQVKHKKLSTIQSINRLSGHQNNLLKMPSDKQSLMNMQISSQKQSFISKQSPFNNNKSLDIRQNTSLKVPAQSKTVIPSDKSINIMNKSYISQLYKTYYILLRQDESQQKLLYINDNIFDALIFDVQSWLQQIKYDLLNGIQKLKPIVYRSSEKSQRQNNKHQITKVRDSNLSQLKTPKIGIQTEEEQVIKQNLFSYQNYQRHHTVHRQDNFTRHHSYSSAHFSQNKFTKTNAALSFNRTQKNLNQIPSKIINVNKLKNCATQPINHKKAMRIKFLQDLDKDYYKMLKSTIKMQKQNTRKNYQFMRTFKRAKYSSRDQILQQKRYECSFSMLFAGRNNEKQKQKIQPVQKKSCFYSNDNSQMKQMRISKMYNKRKSNISSSQIIKSTGSSVNFNARQSKQLKQNINQLKVKIQKKNQQQFKRNLSIQMKDIINLV